MPRLNRKSLSLRRILKSVKDPKFEYFHVGPEGTTVTNNHVLGRVSLPAGETVATPVIYPIDTIETIQPSGDDLVEMPEGLPAKTTGRHIVPQFNQAIPKPEEQSATFTCNAKILIDLLKVATEVTEHSHNLVRLRICRNGKTLRIDSHRNEGEQEFCAILMGINYNGRNIPGDTEKMAATQTENEDVASPTLNLPLTEGRKFRD